MESLEWELIKVLAKTSPDVRATPSFLSFQGAFKFTIYGNDPLSADLWTATSQIEEAFRRNYTGLKVVGEESQNTTWQEFPGTRYRGQIYAQDSTGVVAQLRMSGEQRVFHHSNLRSFVTFFGQLPLDEHHAATNSVMQTMWPHIEGFDMAFPSEQIPAAKRGNESILYMKDGSPIASGKYALQEAGIRVEPKRPLMMSRGILI